jgi:hypothetical protein
VFPLECAKIWEMDVVFAYLLRFGMPIVAMETTISV